MPQASALVIPTPSAISANTDQLATIKELSDTAKSMMDSDRTAHGTTLQGGNGVTINVGQLTR